jgi:uncharacterized membrane protein YqjE
MAEPEPSAPGTLGSLRRICSAVLALLKNRVELFGVELQEQKARLTKVLLLIAATAFLGNTAVLVVTGTIIYLAGDSARKPLLIGLSIFYVGAAVVAAVLLRRELRSARPPFEDSVSELKKDCDWLKRN